MSPSRSRNPRLMRTGSGRSRPSPRRGARRASSPAKRAERLQGKSIERAASSAPAVFCAGVSRGHITSTEDGILLNLRVSPGAKSSSIEGFYGESALKLKVAAPPLNGKANTEAERFLAKLLGISRSNVTVVRGT